jgi:hypothetical protein
MAMRLKAPWTAAAVLTCGVMLVLAGCRLAKEISVPPIPPLGTQIDAIWQTQETNAEAADFIMWQHEFESEGARLNKGGEDHLKMIAYRINQLREDEFFVIVEESMNSPKEGTVYAYPIHPNPELDLKRREVVVRLLTELGVKDAEERVIIAPSWIWSEPGQGPLF